jgi:hypothetical protein
MQPHAIKQALFYIISVFIGLLFIYGAYAKLQDIEPFEWSLAETGIFSFSAANVFTRIFIALEFFIGAMFIGAITSKGKVYFGAACLLTLFNIYLLWIIFTYGNNGNCGCFGEALQMTPIQAYLKNVALLFLIFVLSKWQDLYASKSFRWQLITLSLIALGYTSIVQPPDFIFLEYKQTVKRHTINLNVLYQSEASQAPTFDYKKGKHIISILSTSCSFCKKAARKMHSMQATNPALPFYNVILGDSASADVFLKETLSTNVPHQRNENVPYLYKLANNRLPCILWIEDGNVVNMSNYFNLDAKEIEQWIKN